MLFKKLKQITNCLLESEDKTEINLALKSLHEIFSNASKIRGDILEADHNIETFLEGGVAISPHLAARCLFDPLRTIRFLRGIHAAIYESFARFPGEKIHILYAGCGPYATLLLPLTTQFNSEDVQFTLIDINKPSIDGVKKIIKCLQVGEYINDCVHADAITYNADQGNLPHVIISETMEAGLDREPQVAIMRNLVPQLKKNGIFIPEKIIVEAHLGESKKEDIGLMMHRDEHFYPVGIDQFHNFNRRVLGKIMEVDSTFVHSNEIGSDWDSIPLTTIEIPEKKENFNQLFLQTTVQIFDHFKFEPYDCELSFPICLHEFNGIESGSKIYFNYNFGEKPGINYSKQLRTSNNGKINQSA